MQNIDYHIVGYIAEYLESHEQVCFKFVNKTTYGICELLNLKIREPSFKNKIPLNIVYWLVDTLKMGENFQTSCCTRLCLEKEYCKLYEYIEDRNFSFSIYFLKQCLSMNAGDIILNCIMSKKYIYDCNTIYTAAIMNNKRVIKWCLRNKKLCLRPELFDNVKYDLVEFACKTKIDNISTVKYLINNGFKLTASCLKNCISHNNFNIFKYIINKIKYVLTINFTPVEIMNIAIQYERLNFMKCIKKIYGVRITDITHIYTLVKKYKENRDRNVKECIGWLIDNGKYIFQEDIEIQLIHLGFNV